MTNPTAAPRYAAPAQLAHWLIALLIASGCTLGFIMVDQKISPTTLKLFAYHKWIGVTVFLLALLRLVGRLAVPPPPLPASTAPWQRRAAEITHRLLYLLIFAVPLSGWLMSSAKGFQTVYLKLIPIPDLLDKNPALGAALTEVHESLVWLLLGTVALHVAAALKHHFVDRDGVLLRMLPRFGR